MDNQSELVQMDLVSAAKVIADAVITKRAGLDSLAKELEDKHKQYEQDYIKAAGDGDARENAPLDEAKNNLRNNTGRIGANKKMIQRMDNIDLGEYVKRTFNFEDIYSSFAILTDAQKEKILTTMGFDSIEELVEAIKVVSLDEFLRLINSIYIDATDNGDTGIEKFSHELNAYRKDRNLPDYNSCGIIVPYSTVRINYRGEDMVYRIFPAGISFLDIGVIAADSRVGSAILGRRKGETVTLGHAATKQRLQCKIIDVY